MKTEATNTQTHRHVIKIICRCSCGAKVRIARDSDKRNLCPKCYSVVTIEEHATDDGPVIVRVPIEASQTAPTSSDSTHDEFHTQADDHKPATSDDTLQNISLDDPADIPTLIEYPPTQTAPTTPSEAKADQSEFELDDLMATFTSQDEQALTLLPNEAQEQKQSHQQEESHPVDLEPLELFEDDEETQVASPLTQSESEDVQLTASSNNQTSDNESLATLELFEDDEEAIVASPPTESESEDVQLNASSNNQASDNEALETLELFEDDEEEAAASGASPTNDNRTQEDLEIFDIDEDDLIETPQKVAPTSQTPAIKSVQLPEETVASPALSSAPDQMAVASLAPNELNLDLNTDLNTDELSLDLNASDELAPSSSLAAASPTSYQLAPETETQASPVIEEPSIDNGDAYADAYANQGKPNPADLEVLTCPSCGATLRPGAVICVPCGINVKTGRSLVISRELDLNQLYHNTEQIVKVLSFIIRIGLYPIASEAYASKKPYSIWGISILTILCSIGFWIMTSGSIRNGQNLMLWSGDTNDMSNVAMMYMMEEMENDDYYDDYDYDEEYEENDDEVFIDEDESLIEGSLFSLSSFGSRSPAALRGANTVTAEEFAEQVIDKPDFEARMKEIEETTGLDLSDEAHETILNRKQQDGENEALDSFVEEPTIDNLSDVINSWQQEAANDYLAEYEGSFPEYSHFQLITHSLLHGDLLHIAGNLLIIMVIGFRVNSLIGNTLMGAIYFIMAIAGGVGHMIASTNDAFHPMLGASGAAMGLVGMYLVFFPTQTVYMAGWFRVRMHLGFKIFKWKGFWLVIFLLSFEYIIKFIKEFIGISSNVAHLAHLGGFLCGILIATLLLMTRAIDARGADLYTAILGKHAWKLIGTPNNRKRPGYLQWLNKLP